MKSYGVTIQMKPLQQHFYMVLFIEYVVLTFESVDEILWCYHSNETSSAVLLHGTICFSAAYKMKFEMPLGGLKVLCYVPDGYREWPQLDSLGCTITLWRLHCPRDP